MELELLIPRGAPHPKKVRLHEWYTRLGYVQVGRRDFDEPELSGPADLWVYRKNLRAVPATDAPPRADDVDREQQGGDAQLSGSGVDHVRPGLRGRGRRHVTDSVHPQESRCTNVASSRSVRTGRDGSSRRDSSSSTAREPSSVVGWRMTVSRGANRSAHSKSSKRDERDVVGDLQAALGDRAQQADRHEVVAADDRGRRFARGRAARASPRGPGRAGSRPRRPAPGRTARPARSSAIR